jgi:hypothetical protein
MRSGHKGASPMKDVYEGPLIGTLGLTREQIKREYPYLPCISEKKKLGVAHGDVPQTYRRGAFISPRRRRGFLRNIQPGPTPPGRISPPVPSQPYSLHIDYFSVWG